MVTYNIARAREAVQYLVDSSYFPHHLTKLRSTVDRPRALPFKGEAEVLNELVILGRQNRQAMENLLELAEYKRSGRASYQQQYMAAKRQRDRKVAQLEELLAGRKLALDERVEVLHKQYNVWNRERERFVAKLGEVSWQDRNTALRAFWEAKEQEIDALLIEASKTLTRTTARKRVVVVERQPPKSEFGKKLMDAAKNRKKLVVHK